MASINDNSSAWTRRITAQTGFRDALGKAQALRTAAMQATQPGAHQTSHLDKTIRDVVAVLQEIPSEPEKGQVDAIVKHAAHILRESSKPDLVEAATYLLSQIRAQEQAPDALEAQGNQQSIHQRPHPPSLPRPAERPVRRHHAAPVAPSSPPPTALEQVAHDFSAHMTATTAAAFFAELKGADPRQHQNKSTIYGAWGQFLSTRAYDLLRPSQSQELRTLMLHFATSHDPHMARLATHFLAEVPRHCRVNLEVISPIQIDCALRHCEVPSLAISYEPLAPHNVQIYIHDPQTERSEIFSPRPVPLPNGQVGYMLDGPVFASLPELIEKHFLDAGMQLQNEQSLTQLLRTPPRAGHLPAFNIVPGVKHKLHLSTDDLDRYGLPHDVRLSQIVIEGEKFLASQAEQVGGGGKFRFALRCSDGHAFAFKELRTFAAPHKPEPKTKPLELDDIQREIVALSQVAPASPVINASGKIFVGVPLMDGDLHTLMQNTPDHVRSPLVWNILQQVSADLAKLHERGLVHTDVKLENILYRRDNTYQVTDMGSAQRVDPRTGLAGMGQGWTFVAPEMLLVGTYGTPADIWSLGILASQWLVPTGDSPFHRIRELCRHPSADSTEKVMQSYADFAIYRAGLIDPATRIVDTTKIVSGPPGSFASYFHSVRLANEAACRDILTYFLAPDPKDRFTAKKAADLARFLQRSPRSMTAKLFPQKIEEAADQQIQRKDVILNGMKRVAQNLW